MGAVVTAVAVAGSRKMAIERGEHKYFTGIPCGRGHVTFRYVVNGGCSDCINPQAAEVRGLWRLKIKSKTDHGATMKALGWFVYKNTATRRYKLKPARRDYTVGVPPGTNVIAIGRVLGWWP